MQKSRYIDKKNSEVTLAPGFLRNLFVKSAPFEEKFGKDICEFTSNEIQEFYKFIDVNSLDALALLNSNYAMYTTWCLAETLVPDGQNHFLEVNYDIMLGCMNDSVFDQTIITREEFEEAADTLSNYTDRFALYAIFEGIGGKQFEEITRAKLSDISSSAGSNEIHLCSGRTMAIPTKLREIAEEAVKEEDYHFYSSNRSHLYRKEEIDDLLFKVMNNRDGKSANETKNRGQVVGRRYINAMDYLGFPRQLTPKKLMMSGRIDFIKQLMKREGLPLEQTLVKCKDEINAKYPVGKFGTSFVPFLRKYRRFFSDDHQNKRRISRTA